MCWLVVDGDRVRLEDGWPGPDDLGRVVLLPGGEAGVLTELKRRQTYEPPSVARRRKAKRAQVRRLRALRRWRETGRSDDWKPERN